MAVIRIKKRKDETNDEDSKPKKIRIKRKVKEENGKPNLKVNLRRIDSNIKNIDQEAGSTVKLKLNLKKGTEPEKVPKPPRLRVKPIRVPGEGYDSEASDVEDDPLIEEGVILRVLPDMQAEFVKSSIESGDYSGINIKWKGHGHAIVNINDVSYGAVLVNMPTIVEAHKSVDRKNLLKTFDISQMLLCVKAIENEQEVFTLTPPDAEDLISKHFEEYQDEINDAKKKILKGHIGVNLTDTESRYIDQIALKPYDYKHGLTPALYNARNRRFRRKMGLDEFEYAEQVVERLLKQDDQSEEVTYELVDEDEASRRSASAVNLNHFVDSTRDLTSVTDHIDEEKEEDDLDLDAAFQSDEDADAETAPNTNALFEETGDDVEQYNGEEDEDDDEDDEDDEDDDDPAGENGVMDKEEVNEDRQHNELLKDELHELETTLNQTKQKLQKATNMLLKSRFVESIKKLEKEVELKRKQLKYSDESLQDGERDSPPNHATPHEEDEDEEDNEPEPEPDAEVDPDEDEEDVEDVEDAPEDDEPPEHVPDQELDQNDLDMMMLFGAEGDDPDAD